MSKTQGVVINGGGVVDWTSEDVFVVDFSELNELASGDEQNYDNLASVVNEYNSVPRGVFPDATYADLLDVAQIAVENLNRLGYRAVWSEVEQHIEIFPGDDQSYGDHIDSKVSGGYAVYDPKGDQA